MLKKDTIIKFRVSVERFGCVGHILLFRFKVVEYDLTALNGVTAYMTLEKFKHNLYAYYNLKAYWYFRVTGFVDRWWEDNI